MSYASQRGANPARSGKLGDALMRRTRLAVLVLAAAALSLPVSAQAGFLTDVVKGTVKNGARHAKQTAKDAAQLGGLVAGCVARRAVGRQC